MTWRDSGASYGRVSRLLHWLMALLILANLASGLVMGDLDPGPTQNFLYEMHKSFGISILLLVAVRLFWRWREGFATLPPTTGPLQALAARANHLGLYALMVFMPIVGYIYTDIEAGPVAWFGLRVPITLPKDEGLSNLAGLSHWTGGYLLIALLLLHVAAAFLHHLYFRDDVLRRMTWGR